MKFGPEEKFEENYDRSEFFKYDKSGTFDVHLYNAPTYYLKLTTVECMEFAKEFFDSRDAYNEEGSTNHVFSVFYPHSYRSTSIGVRCAEYGKRGITDVSVMGAGLDRDTTRTLTQLLDRRYEDSFEKLVGETVFEE